MIVLSHDQILIQFNARKCQFYNTLLSYDSRYNLVQENEDSFLFRLSEDHTTWCILIMKANEMHYFSNLFDKVIYVYMFRTNPLSIIRSISTLYTRNSYLSCYRGQDDHASMTNTYCVCTVLRYSRWRTLDLSEWCRVLNQINLRNSASNWLLL